MKVIKHIHLAKGYGNHAKLSILDSGQYLAVANSNGESFSNTFDAPSKSQARRDFMAWLNHVCPKCGNYPVVA
jgi:hypothetical protein